MHEPGWMAWTVVLCALVAGAAPSDPASPPATSASPSGTETPPTTADEEAQEPTGEKIPVPGEYPLQENPLAGCSICHVDIEDQFVGSLHFKEKVGCKTCHGPSEGHLADENNEVKPDEVYARKDVDRLCGRCHECARPKPSDPEVAAAQRQKVCIDCHGAHDVALADGGTPPQPSCQASAQE